MNQDPNMPWGSTPPTPENTKEQTHIDLGELKGLWIPAAYLYAKDLTPVEMILMSYIHMADQKNHCWVSNSKFGEWLGISKLAAKNLIVKLKSKGYIEQVSWDGRSKRVLKCLK
jgi:DNA-binding MarR family transcriptional regulator